MEQSNHQAFCQMYLKAQELGLCTDKKSFAEFIGCNVSSVNSALNGARNTPTDFVRAAELALLKQERGLSIGGDNTQSPINLGGQQKNFGLQAQDLAQVVNTLCHEMAEQRMSYERLLMAAINGQKLAEK